ncbi:MULTISPECIES: response regulator [unclassified Devosia]|uniref:response regulator n=1 Tax=unclassified Devosia TaxID=196773 RepID=UPI0025F4056B|nr:response regulator [Devosia sp.]MCR6636109.1 response regulator [Devosia sp.]
MDKIVKHGVVIADPVENMASLIAAMVRGLGHRMVLEITNPRELKAVLDSRSYSLIILDDMMGPPDAVEMVRQMRTDVDSPNRTTSVIMMSSAPDIARIAEARDAGVSEFLKKPFSATDLQKRIAGLDIKPREFIEAPEYAGPDRRRRKLTAGIADQRTVSETET